MATHLIRKLERFSPLSGEAKHALERATSITVRQLKPRQDIVQEGDKPRQVHVMLEGWACRYRILPDGRRQIMGHLVPGDICDLRMFILKQMDHTVSTISAARVAEVPSDTLLALTDAFPRISRALWWVSLVEEAISREWIVNNSQREAGERLAHLFCEIFLRLRAVGLTNGQSCDVPLTQAELAETTGLSTVHVNRTLQDLRAAGLIILKGKHLTIPDLAALKAAALFNPNYLHLDRDGGAFDANEP